MELLDRLFRKRRRHRRVEVRLAVNIAGCDDTFYTQDVAQGGMRMSIGRQVSLADVTGGSRDVSMTIQVADGEAPVQVVGEPIWTVRTEDGELSTGWMFSRFEGDGLRRLRAFVDSVP